MFELVTKIVITTLICLTILAIAFAYTKVRDKSSRIVMIYFVVLYIAAAYGMWL